MIFFIVLPFLQVIVIFLGDTVADGITELTRMVGLEKVNPEAEILSSAAFTETAVVAAFFSPVLDSITSAINCDLELRSFPQRHDAVGKGTIPLYLPSSGVVPSVS